MKKKSHLVPLLVGSFLLVNSVSCGKRTTKWELVDGGSFPTAMEAELGMLFNIPEINISSKKDGLYEYEAVVVDSTGKEVKISNNKFRVSDLGGYTIKYTANGETKEIHISVKDSVAPKITTISAQSGFSMVLNREFVIPNYTVTDSSDPLIPSTVSVVDPNGAAVEVVNNRFTPTVVGKYTITISSTDSSNNSSSKKMEIDCAEGELLNPFNSVESGQGVTSLSRAAWTKETTNGNSISADGGVKVSYNADDSTWSFIKFSMKKDGEPLLFRDLTKFDRVQLYIYSSYDAEIFMQGSYGKITLQPGMNIVVFDVEDIVNAQNHSIEQRKTNSNVVIQYNEVDGTFYLQFRNSPANQYFVFDELIGIYAPGCGPSEQSKVEFNINGCDGMVIDYGKEIEIPSAKPIFDGTTELDYNVTVTNGNGNVEVIDNKFVASELGEYKIKYTCTTSGYENESREISVNCVRAKLLNDFSSVNCVTSLGRAAWTKEVVDSGVVSADGVKVSTNSDETTWSFVTVSLLDEGKPISLRHLAQYEYIQLNVYSNYTTILNLRGQHQETTIYKGHNVVKFYVQDLLNVIEEYKNEKIVQYNEASGSLYIEIRKSPADKYLIFDSAYGVYADDAEAYSLFTDDLSGMKVVANQEFKLPEASAKDIRNQDTPYSVSVKDSSGQPVEVVNGKFTPSEGTYTIRYSVDADTNECVEYSIEAVDADVLADFHETSDISAKGRAAWALEVVNEDVLTESGVKLDTLEDSSSWSFVLVKLTKDGMPVKISDLSKYESIEFIINASYSTIVDLCGQVGETTLKAGYNSVVFDVDDILSQIEATKENNIKQYDDGTGSFYLGIRKTPDHSSLIFDSVIGIYPTGYIGYSIDTENLDGLKVIAGNEFTLPASTAQTNKGVAANVVVSVKDSSGQPVEVVNGKFTPSEGTYTIRYSVEADASEFIEYTIKAVQGVELTDFDVVSDVSSKGRAAWTLESSEENTLDGKGIKLDTVEDASTWSFVTLKLTKDGQPISVKDLAKFESVDINFYSSYGTTLYLADTSVQYKIKAGYNTISLKGSELIDLINATAEAKTKQYNAETGSFFFGLKETPAHSTIVFDSVVGAYPTGYVGYSITGNNVLQNMTVLAGQEFMVPAASAKNNKDETVNYVVTVKNAIGQDVTLTNGKFTPSEGTYTIRYSVEADPEEFVEYTIGAKNGVMLNDCSDASALASLGRAAWTKSVVTENVLTESGVALNTNADSSSWQSFCVVLNKDGAPISLKDLKKFESIQMFIYSNIDVTMMICGQVNTVNLKAGMNVYTISASDLLAGLEANTKQYTESTGAFLLSPKSTPANTVIVIDSIIGVYPEGYVECTISNPEFEKTTVKKGEQVTLPTVEAKAGNQSTTYFVTVKNENNDNVEVVDNKFTPNFAGTYTIRYTVTDHDDIYVEVTLDVIDYVMLNDCSNANALTSLGRAAWTKSVVTENVLTESGVALNTNADSSSWQSFCVVLNKNGAPISLDELKTFDSIQMYIYTNIDLTMELCGRKNPVALKAGANTYSISAANLLAAIEANASQYNETTGAFKLCPTSTPADTVIIIDSIVGVYSKGQTVSNISTNIVDGMKILAGKEFELPLANTTNNKGISEAYTVTVKDSSLQNVAITGNKFTPAVGTYTIKYVLNSDENKFVEYTVTAVEGTLLSECSSVNDLTGLGRAAWTKSVNTEFAFNSTGVALSTNADTSSWQSFYVVLNKDGAPISLDDLKSFSSIQMYIYSNIDMTMMIAGQKNSVNLTAGRNIYTISAANLAAAIEANAKQYTESSGAFLLAPKSTPANTVIVLDYIIGIN